MRRAARVDANQAQIIAALRQAGASVQLLHTVGDGCPDLLVGIKRRTFLLEVKDASGQLTAAQRRWFAGWRGQAAIVRSAEDALRVVGLARPADRW